jgi:chromosome segregation ATPase
VVSGRRFPRPEEAEELIVSGAELLDRIERQAAELGTAQERIAELEQALAEVRERGIEAAKALKAESRLRRAAEASLGRMTEERDLLSGALEQQRATAARLDEELEAANTQAAMLDERMRTVWAEAQGGELDRPKRGLRRLARGDG